jgi:hypothetical protein
MALALLTRLYRLGLNLYPPRFREQFADEMAAVFSEQLAAAAARGGAAAFAAGARELAGLVGQGLLERLYAWQSRPALVAQTNTGTELSANRRPARRLAFLFVALALVLACAWLAWAFFMAAWRASENTPSVQQVALADLNGDGALDAFLAVGHGNMPFPAYALFNDGAGRLGDAQALAKWPGYSVALGDLNDDGQADALIDITAGGLVLYLNRGEYFREYGEVASPGPKGVMRLRPVLGDLNGDGRLDVFAAGCCGREAGEQTGDGRLGEHLLPYSQAWLQTEDHLLAPGPPLGQAGSHAAALADLDGDGDLDAFLANGRTLDANGQYQTTTPNTVWLNDGHGSFLDSGQRLGQAESMAVALGDLDGDGFADAVVGNRGADEVWLNDGHGAFLDSGQRLGSGLTEEVFLADLDGDGDPDLYAAGETTGRAWFNDGRGQFQRGGQVLRYGRNEAVVMGDLDGDGLADMLVVGAEAYRVWRNDGSGRFVAEARGAYR